MALTVEQARERLGSMLAYAEEPALTDAQLEDLLTQSQLADSAGRAPSDPDYVLTVNLNIGAAEGWRWKAALAANRYSHSTDVHNYQRSDLHKHCEAMALKYSRRISGTVTITSRLGSSSVDPVVGN